MSSPADISVATRRRFTFGALAFAALLCAIGVLCLLGTVGGAVRVFGVVALLAAIFPSLLAWATWRTITAERAEQRLDAAINDTLEHSGIAGQLCSCGVKHDPTELHVTDAEPADASDTGATGPAADACAHDGHGASCTHSCETCVLAGLRS